MMILTCFLSLSNEGTLKKVYWKHFLSDIDPLIADFSIVSAEVRKKIKLLKSYLIKKHQGIMDNFDPKVVKFKKKRKVIMAPGVFDNI